MSRLEAEKKIFQYQMPHVKTRILYHSHNLIEWTEVIRFKKDILPMMFFKFGVISFAEGAQSNKDFILFGEGLVDLEGTTIRASID